MTNVRIAPNAIATCHHGRVPGDRNAAKTAFAFAIANPSRTGSGSTFPRSRPTSADVFAARTARMASEYQRVNLKYSLSLTCSGVLSWPSWTVHASGLSRRDVPFKDQRYA